MNNRGVAPVLFMVVVLVVMLMLFLFGIVLFIALTTLLQDPLVWAILIAIFMLIIAFWSSVLSTIRGIRGAMR